MRTFLGYLVVQAVEGRVALVHAVQSAAVRDVHRVHIVQPSCAGGSLGTVHRAVPRDARSDHAAPIRASAFLLKLRL